MAGDVASQKLLADRIFPVRRDRTVKVALPEIGGTATLVAVNAALLRAAASGELTPGEAEALGKLVEGHRRTIEATELEARIARLEAEAKA